MAINDVLVVMEMDWLPEIEWKVLLALAHIKNHKTGLCYPSYEEIARVAHFSDSSSRPVGSQVRDPAAAAPAVHSSIKGTASESP